MSGSNETISDGAAGREVVSLLGEQVGLYQRLEQLAEAQRKLIEIDDTRPLLKLLAQRRKLTTALAQLSARLAPYRDHWDDLKAALAPAECQAIDELVAEAGRRLRRILDKDEADGRLLAAKKTSMAQSLGELETGRRTLAAYGAGTGKRLSILDRTEA